MDVNISSISLGMLTALLMFQVGLCRAQEGIGGLSEVIVTAQKRTENVQSVPASIAVFDATILEKSRIVALDEVASRTVGLTMNRLNIGEPLLSIRGVGSASDSAAADPTVSVFQDELYIGRVSGAAFDLFDVERVEVLRGPQGTLYGRNTAGGAINIISKQPVRNFQAAGHVGYGNYAAMDAQGMVNGPVLESSALRFAFSHRQHSGYSSNILTGEDLGAVRGTSARLGFMSTLSMSTRLRLSLDWINDDNGGNARVPGPVFTDQTGTNAIALAALLRLWPLDSDVRRSYADSASFQKRDILGLMGRLEHDTALGTLTLLGGWRSVDLNWFEDLDSLKPFGNPPLPNVPPATYGWVVSSKDRALEEAQQMSFEARLNSPKDSLLKWVGGIHYFDETVDRAESFNTLFSLVPAGSGDVSFLQDADNRSTAVYGQVDYPLDAALNLMGGLRYTRDEKSVLQVARNDDPSDPTPGIPLFPGQPYNIKANDDWNSLTGKLGIDWQVTPQLFLYASASRGFKSGIFPSQNNVVQNVGVATPPEKVMSYEAGAKTDWLDSRLRINAALFEMDYKDLQLYRLDAQLRLITFTEDARITGAEFEMAITSANHLWLGVAYAYLDTEVRRGANAGNVLPRAPRNKLSSYAERNWPTPVGELSARIEYQWTDTFNTEVPNTRATSIPAYGLLDARVAFQFAGQRIEIALWGKNLRDQTYATHITPFLGNGFSVFGPPRTFGASLSWRTPG